MRKQSIRTVRFASVAWQVGDITSVYPEVSEEQAAEFLRRNGKYIQEAMVQAGWNAIAACLNYEGTEVANA
jgi:hypothetical protein